MTLPRFAQPISVNQFADPTFISSLLARTSAHRNVDVSFVLKDADPMSAVHSRLQECALLVALAARSEDPQLALASLSRNSRFRDSIVAVTEHIRNKGSITRNGQNPPTTKQAIVQEAGTAVVRAAGSLAESNRDLFGTQTRGVIRRLDQWLLRSPLMTGQLQTIPAISATVVRR